MVFAGDTLFKTVGGPDSRALRQSRQFLPLKGGARCFAGRTVAPVEDFRFFSIQSVARDVKAGDIKL